MSAAQKILIQVIPLLLLSSAQAERWTIYKEK